MFKKVLPLPITTFQHAFQAVTVLWGGVQQVIIEIIGFKIKKKKETSKNIRLDDLIA